MTLSEWRQNKWQMLAKCARDTVQGLEAYSIENRQKRKALAWRVLSSARSRRWQRRKSWERSSCMRSYWQIWFVPIQTIGYKLFLSRTSILNQSSAESGHGVLNDLSLILWWWRCFQCRTKHDTVPHSQGGRIKSWIFTDWCAHVLFSSSQRSIKSQIS